MRGFGEIFGEEQDSLQDFYESLLKVNLYHSTEFTQVQEERPQSGELTGHEEVRRSREGDTSFKVSEHGGKGNGMGGSGEGFTHWGRLEHVEL